MSSHKTKEQILAEAKLIEEAKRDPRRFSPLYDAYYKQIFLFINRRVENFDITADICSQVFIKALGNIKSFKFKGVPFSAWLYRIASNEVNQHFRKTKSQRTVCLDDSIAMRLAAEISDDEEEDKMGMLIKILDELKPIELELVEMRFFEGRSFREISEILGTTENNAKVKTHRVIQKMKKLIDRLS